MRGFGTADILEEEPPDIKEMEAAMEEGLDEGVDEGVDEGGGKRFLAFLAHVKVTGCMVWRVCNSV